MSLVLIIDGEPTLPGEVSILPQRDPFPGGASVRIELETEKRRYGFEAFPEHGAIDLDYEQNRKILSALTKHLVSAGDHPLRFFLNRMERAEFDGTRIVIEGIASPVASSLK